MSAAFEAAMDATGRNGSATTRRAGPSADWTRASAGEIAAAVGRDPSLAVTVAEAHLALIAARDGEIGAFAHVDREQVLAEARALGEGAEAGAPPGPLAGVPVALKDVIDTADLPTENGTPIDAGRRPERDATVVKRLRAAGAVILGKTVTAELAYFTPGRTRNPHDPARTPGGSSSGSAAAVAAHMAPLALGTQTTGSTIRPAAFCGVVGYKPSFGLIPRTGILRQSAELDTVGVFARSLADAALVTDVLQGPDGEDADAKAAPPPSLAEALRGDPPADPLFALVAVPSWDAAEATTRREFAGLRTALGRRCDAVAPPEACIAGLRAQRLVNLVGLARNFARYDEKAPDLLSERLRSDIREGQGIAATDYLGALDLRGRLRAELSPLLERYDALVMPAAPGEAPRGLASTGNPVFCALWTFLGFPAVTLPLLSGPAGLPIGVQLVAGHSDDARLLRAAAWLARHVGGGDAA